MRKFSIILLIILFVVACVPEVPTDDTKENIIPGGIVVFTPLCDLVHEIGMWVQITEYYSNKSVFSMRMTDVEYLNFCVEMR